jgi:CHAT domain-containing protein
LVRGFLAAGASSIIVSLWIVHDATTILLMDQHYANLGQGFGRAEALRRAQLAIKATHAHPYYWAPFITVGHG